MWDWSLKTAMGEMIGSFMLTLGIIFISLMVKRKSMHNISMLAKRLFKATSVFTIVVISITTAKGFGAPGAINPAIALMIKLYEGWSQFIIIVVFDFIGGILGALAFLLFAYVYNQCKENNEKIVVSNMFKFSEQSLTKSFAMEGIANIFWYLPVMGMVMLHLKESGNVAGEFFIPIIAGFAIFTVLIIIPEIGVANLNPQVWFGEFILKLIGSKGSINSKQLISELSGLLSTFAIAAIIGAIAVGINPYK